MDHPEIYQAMRTGFPSFDYIEHENYAKKNHGVVAGHPEEDMFGQKITHDSVYFVDGERNVIHADNIRDYLTEVTGVVFYEAK